MDCQAKTIVSKIHVKFRLDKADSKFLIKLLKKYGIKWSSINNKKF